jgi:hypothetical protein
MPVVAVEVRIRTRRAYLTAAWVAAGAVVTRWLVCPDLPQRLALPIAAAVAEDRPLIRALLRAAQES